MAYHRNRSSSLSVFTLLVLGVIVPGGRAWNAQASDEELVFAFRGHNRTETERMVVVGEVVSIEKADLLDSTPTTDLNLDTRPDNVVVKVLSPKGVRVGQTLYLVEKDPNHKKFRDGNIVGQIVVKSIFDTTFFGKQLRGEGHTRLIEYRHVTVVRLQESVQTEEALLAKKKGDVLAERGEIALAMAEYRKSIALDPNLPDPHYALGVLHKKEGDEWKFSALSEYSMAWKHRENFSGVRDRYQFYMSYLGLLKSYIQTQPVTDKKIPQHWDRMLEIVRDSEKLIGRRFETTVYQAWVHYQIYRFLPKENSERFKNFELSRKKMEEASRMNRESLFYHETAILLFEDDREKLRRHGKRYLTINPPGNPIPLEIVEILEKL